MGQYQHFFGVCEVFGLDEKLLMMPKDCNILHINLGSISNGMSIVFSPYIQKFYIDQFSLRHNSSGVLELDFCFSSSTANNIVDSIVNTIKDAVSYCNRSGKINIDLRLNLVSITKDSRLFAILDMNDTYFVDLNTLNGLYKMVG